MVTFELFVRPVLRRLSGWTRTDRPRVQVTLTEDVAHASGRQEYVRATIWVEASQFFARPAGRQGSGILNSMIGANGLIVLPGDSPGFQSGTSVDALLIDASLAGRPA